VYKLRVTTLRTSAMAVLVAFALAGCGGATRQAAKPQGKDNARAFDTLNVCGLADDNELRTALGEAPGNRDRRDADTLKVCAIDGVSERFYLFVAVQRSPAGAQQQLDYDRAAAKDPKTVDSGTFSYSTDGEAHVETLNGQLVVRVSFVYYADGGKVSDAQGLIDRLLTLLRMIVQRV
jgi:hypothetical protein